MFHVLVLVLVLVRWWVRSLVLVLVRSLVLVLVRSWVVRLWALLHHIWFYIVRDNRTTLAFRFVLHPHILEICGNYLVSRVPRCHNLVQVLVCIENQDH